MDLVRPSDEPQQCPIHEHLTCWLAVLGLELAPIQVISVVATNCKEGSKMLY